MLFSDIKVVFIIFRVYFSFLNCSGISVNFFCSLLTRLLLLFTIFATAPLLARRRFFVSLFKILNMFCTLFYCYYHWAR